MSLMSLDNGWKQFGNGRKWRCIGPAYRCEVDDEGNTPNYMHISSTLAKLRRIKSFYLGRVTLGILDEFGYGADVLTANSFTESLGTVPSPLSTSELRSVYNDAPGMDNGVKLDHVIRYISSRAKYLERREPGYTNPLAKPDRVSVGSHHVLIATAVGLSAGSGQDSPEARETRIADLICRLPAESRLAAEYAVKYFNRAYSKHLNQPPLLAATYNAGSPRPDSTNPWNLRQYGAHIDRWVAYFNTSRMAG
jgi:hypothetical protein